MYRQVHIHIHAVTCSATLISICHARLVLLSTQLIAQVFNHFDSILKAQDLGKSCSDMDTSITFSAPFNCFSVPTNCVHTNILYYVRVHLRTHERIQEV